MTTPSGPSSTRTDEPSSMPNFFRSLAGMTTVPRFPTLAGSPICPIIRHSGNGRNPSLFLRRLGAQATQDRVPVLGHADVSLRYDRAGAGPAVLFVHGWACNRTFWERQVQALRDRYTVVTVDLRGHGESARPRTGYTVGAMVGDLERIVRALAVSGVALVGLVDGRRPRAGAGGPAGRAGDRPGARLNAGRRARASEDRRARRRHRGRDLRPLPRIHSPLRGQLLQGGRGIAALPLGRQPGAEDAAARRGGVLRRAPHGRNMAPSRRAPRADHRHARTPRHHRPARQRRVPRVAHPWRAPHGLRGKRAYAVPRGAGGLQRRLRVLLAAESPGIEPVQATEPEAPALRTEKAGRAGAAGKGRARRATAPRRPAKRR